ncbi:MAG: 2,3-bisphosphoglycerate-independent phosphoglycerate mutase [Lacrimispora sp.]|uniref:2,3-bisphosphoglycerate-independent phosphoglycerate mutase n=1 Tax=Lacrimispora sp. TaxID=2719234 RepID=UPI0039E66A17
MRKRQGILIISDGLGDRPIKVLNGMTPLEYAYTPNLDCLAREGSTGNVYPIAPGIPVGTDVGHMEIFGCDSDKYYPGRGPLEALSAGIEMKEGDVAFRGNFGTVDEENIVIDRRAGRIKDGTAELAKALSGMCLEDGTLVLVKELTEHRVAVVLRGKGLSAAIVPTDVGTANEGVRLVVPHPENPQCEEALKTAENLWEFTKKASDILKDHPVNQERIRNGLLPANVILTRGPGQLSAIPSTAKKTGIRALCIAGDITVGGIAGLVGFDYYVQDSFTGGFTTDYMGKAQKAVEAIGEGYDWVVIHVKGTDLAGHDNQPLEKVRIIEEIDGMMGYIMNHIEKDRCYIAFTADHSTPCEAKDHTGDGVPTIIWGPDVRRDKVEMAGEAYFMEGALQNLKARDIFALQMDLMGFSKKRGA